jgi:hypothetical protein
MQLERSYIRIAFCMCLMNTCCVHVRVATLLLTLRCLACAHTIKAGGHYSCTANAVTTTADLARAYIRELHACAIQCGEHALIEPHDIVVTTELKEQRVATVRVCTA